MSAAELVVVCALQMLGRSPERLPPIRVLEAPPPGASANASAFLDRGEGAIYLIASAPAFKLALEAQPSSAHCAGRDALQMVASIIVHEEWHLKHGPDERGAYLAQLTALQRLGSGPGRWPYASVVRAMQHVLAAEEAARARTLQARAGAP